MKNVLYTITRFLRITDDQGNLSLTNLSMYLALYKLLVAPNAGFAEVGTYLLAVAAYNYKKALGQDPTPPTTPS